MTRNDKGQRITVYFGESDTWQHQSLALALLEMLRREGCSGATVTRGAAGFGAGSRIKTSTILRLSFDLPMVLTVVDTPERVARLLPKLSAMVDGGLITVEDVNVYQYSSRFKDTLPDLPVREVITTPVTTVRPETTLAEAMGVLLQHVFTALPVVDAQQRVCGMLHEDDLLTAGATELPFSLHRALEPIAQEALLTQDVQRERTVETVMRRDVPTIDPEASIRTAAHLMLTRDVRQLPVVDASGVLVGIISRIDLLRTVSAGYMPQEGVHPTAVPTGGAAAPVSELMSTEIPTVSWEAPLADVVAVLLGAADRCALVLEAAGCLVGIVTPSDLVRRLDPDLRPGLAQIIRSHLPLVGDATRQGMRKATAKRARELMTTPVVSVTPDTPISTALLLATQRRLKRLPVCDSQQRPAGLVSRKDLLRAVVR
jgi:CBS domain-containing protein